MIEKIYDWLKANWYLTLLGTIGFIYFIPSSKDVLSTVFIAIVLESLSLLLFKNIINYVMKDSQLKTLFSGDDGILSKNETMGLSIFQGFALFSAHVLVSIVTLAVYFAV